MKSQLPYRNPPRRNVVVRFFAELPDYYRETGPIIATLNLLVVAMIVLPVVVYPVVWIWRYFT